MVFCQQSLTLLENHYLAGAPAQTRQMSLSTLYPLGVIGVELTQWVEHNQLSTGKTKEFFEKSYLKIIRSEDEPRPERIGMVWLSPKGRRVRPQDVALFRQEVFSFLEQQNRLTEPGMG